MQIPVTCEHNEIIQKGANAGETERLLLKNRNECPVPIWSSNGRILKHGLDFECKLTSEGRERGKKNQRDIPSQTLLFLPISSAMVK